MDVEIRKYAAALAAETGLDIQLELVSQYPAQPFHPDCIAAVYMAQLCEAGMIFIPCKDGISHNEIEDTKPEEITAGCNVLLHAILERAGA
ncbi:MAG: hypothetical protein QM739_09985 [Propionivibrio sp.]